ncbi:acyltransferase [Mucilaginibacter sp. OK283]|jgi:peptidoglycan/LPS O-acetylase OafA/YrhL|uniref:acyltransferase family protein n=1 Tax=Mucilaginibacter sp. OK283 TaxID=1881049 RepID=UPI0008C1E3F6|nr:acyltransferase [Mucilaginibacter sp. OK283]SEP45923.1 Peptidoglycan/LPS O-acetylase OafA/YrhL, contains acyltransferase and SGNH-hydrolase domains [Mucilaginibacter sp. OK283]
MSTIPATLKTKQHFEILDGMRGVAALAVVVFHFTEFLFPSYDVNFIGHGFLAVDFFFCLSGFVIGYAYDDRIGKMGVLEFFKSRIIRLHPLVILGSVLGLIGFLVDPFGGHPEAYSVGRLALIFVSSMLLIPFPAMQERYFNLFSFNAPAWSLFWEYIANIVYAFVLYRLARKYLVVLLVIAAAALSFVAFHAKILSGGWAGENFWEGGARIFYSFTAGLLVYRFNFIIKNKLGFIGLALLLLAALMMPHSKWNWLAQLLVVLFYFPLLIALGAGATLSGGLKKLCNFSGNISYPLYMTHYVGIWFFGNYVISHKPPTSQIVYIVIAGVILLVGMGYLAMVAYDIPVRKYLSGKRQQG